MKPSNYIRKIDLDHKDETVLTYDSFVNEYLEAVAAAKMNGLDIEVGTLNGTGHNYGNSDSFDCDDLGYILIKNASAVDPEIMSAVRTPVFVI